METVTTATRLRKAITEVCSVTEVEPTMSMDTFLDNILWAQKKLQNMARKTSKLCDSLESGLARIEDEHSLSQIANELRDCVKACTLFYNSVYKSKYYGGLKTDMAKYRVELENLREHLNDLDLRIKHSKPGSKLHAILTRLSNR